MLITARSHDGNREGDNEREAGEGLRSQLG
jgi:hypothetical protein